MSTGEIPNYDGSYLLMPLANASGLSIDKVNFLVCQLAAILIGYLFRTILGPRTTSATTRHVVEVFIGIFFTVLCFGSQTGHVVLQSVVCLLMMKFLPPGIMEKSVFVVAMGYLCYGHISRMITDYGGYTLDITGPLMINTQRLTSLAYNIVDGKAKENSKQSDIMKQRAVKKFPTILEYSSYTFSFHMIICGPFCFYNDYIAFIDGSNLVSQVHHEKTNGEANGGSNGEANGGANVDNYLEKGVHSPDPTVAVVKKVIAGAICAYISTAVAPQYPLIDILEPWFLEKYGIVHKMLYVMWGTSLQRHKYYFAWKLAEAVNISAGLGFNGYDKQGKAKWDLIDNVDAWDVETSTSLKVLLDSWNKMTSQWLRYVIYERCHNTFAVFMFSALWHGFYPGYYITFIGGGIFIHTSRMVRRNIRPMFQSSQALIFLYDFITFLGTRLAIAYLTLSFVLLDFWPSLAIHREMYFWMFIATIALAVVLTVKPLSKPTRSREATRSKED